MPTYILLSTLTPEGSQTLHKNPDRLEEVNKEIADFGCTMVGQYATLGEYDFVSIIEVPDQNAIKHLFRRGILAAARGTFQVCTLPALPFEEFVNVVGDIRPPEEPPSSQVAKSISDTGEWP